VIEIEIQRVNTKSQKANFLTKTLQTKIFEVNHKLSYKL
jgi:hypothetical protein